MRRLACLFVLLLAGCVYTDSRPTTPGPGPGPAVGLTLHVQVVDVDGPPVAGASVCIQDGPNEDKCGVTDARGQVFLNDLKVSGQTVCAELATYEEDPGGNTGLLTWIYGRECEGLTLLPPSRSASGCVDDFNGRTCYGSGNVTFQLHKVKPPAPVIVARQGQVVADKHALKDDDGYRLFWGASLFWSLWGEQHDRERLDANLKAASEAGADFVRVFAQVGGTSWADRAVDPRDAGWQEAVRSFTDRAYRQYGLRVEWTLFAWAKNLTHEQRKVAVDRYLAAIDGQHHAVFATEVSNEGWQNGPEPMLARDLAGRVRSKFGGLLAITAPNGDSCEKQALWYRDSPASLVSLHFSRDINKEGGRWRPVRQPWRESTFSCSGQAKAYISNEPIGPGASVASEADPLRLVMSAVVGWVGGVGAYVYHTDAGIRGGGFADKAVGRVANLWEVKRFGETAMALNAMRSALPQDLPNWTRGTSHPSMFKVATFEGPSNPGKGTIDRVYCAWKGSEFVCAAFNVYKPTTLTATRPLSVKVLNPIDASVLQDVTLAEGGTLRLDGVAGGTAYVLRGEFK